MKALFSLLLATLALHAGAQDKKTTDKKSKTVEIVNPRGPAEDITFISPIPLNHAPDMPMAAPDMPLMEVDNADSRVITGEEMRRMPYTRISDIVSVYTGAPTTRNTSNGMNRGRRNW